MTQPDEHGRRPLRPRAAIPEAAAPRTEEFADRQIGLLAEQGQFEQARRLLTRRVSEGEPAASVYLDAIRLERSAAPRGTAWKAWLSRAQQGGVRLLPELLHVVPADAVARHLLERGHGYGALRGALEANIAHSLLALALHPLLDRAPTRALPLLEDPELQRAAREDPALAEVVVGALAVVAWQQPAAARELSQALPAPDDARALLERALRMQPAWQALEAGRAAPAALRRVLQLGPVVDADAARRLREELAQDMAARPEQYVAFCERAVYVSSALARQCGELLDGLRADDAATGAPASQGATVERCVESMQRHLAGDPLRKLGWLAASAATLGVGALFALQGPLPGAAALGAALFVGVPLAHGVRALLYRRNLRTRLRKLVMDAHLDLHAAVGAVVEHPGTHGATARLLAHARRDAALSLLGHIAAAARADEQDPRHS
ncbi:MAG: hypothetical protein PVI30_07900 [Myxococcales bacterium]